MEPAAGDPIRPPISAEEEAAKRNTDCVYFLASPLTCKKGSECEYRHSEGARINPRDCFFWLNGNCLNPKCSFRHPPLDGLLGSPTATASGPALPSLQTAMSTQVPAAYAPSAYTSNKQSTPCIFFQKGGCLKGDKCPFLHGPPSVNNSTPQQAGKVATPIEPSNTSKNPSWALEKCMQQNKLEISADKRVEVLHSLAKVNAKAEITPNNGLAVKSTMLPTPLADEMAHRSQPNNVSQSVSNSTERPQAYHLQPVDECIQNGREPDDSLRESSPGFDVLVDNEGEDADYFHKDDEFGGASDYGGKNPNLVNDFDYHHPSDYDSVTAFERETYDEIGEHGHHGRRDWYDREHHISSERTVKRSSMPERRGARRENSPDRLDASDLRHRLLKQRRLNGPRSVISPDNYGEPYLRDDQYVEEQRSRSRSSRRDQRNIPHERSISNRLQGRITLPGRPADNYSNLHSEGLIDRGRNWGRSSSPGRPLNGQGRHHDIIKERARKDITAEVKNLGGQLRRQDEVDSLEFAGPKSLAELKGGKFSGKSEITLAKIDNCTITTQKKLEGSPLFEGPKPLSVILKRKREGTPGNDAVLSNGHENNARAIEEHGGVHTTTTITDIKSIQPVESENGGRHTVSNIEVPKSTAVVEEEEEEEEGLIVSDGEDLSYEGLSSPKEGVLDTEDDKLADNMGDPEFKNDRTDGESKPEDADGEGFKMEDGEGLPHPDQSLHKEEMLKTEDSMLVDDMESPELQNSDQKVFEYETAEGANFNTEDGEYPYEEDEDLDDEDGDDFARKLGAMLS